MPEGQMSPIEARVAKFQPKWDDEARKKQDEKNKEIVEGDTIVKATLDRMKKDQERIRAEIAVDDLEQEEADKIAKVRKNISSK